MTLFRLSTVVLLAALTTACASAPSPSANAPAEAVVVDSTATAAAPLPPEPPIDPATMPPAPGDAERINFEANSVSYDQDNDTVTASGDVVLRSEDRSVRADQVTWSRTSGQIVATGDVRFVDEDGNQLYTSRIELNDEFEAGAMEDLLLALREGGRLAAANGERLADGTIELTTAAYTGCEVATATMRRYAQRTGSSTPAATTSASRASPCARRQNPAGTGAATRLEST